MSGNVTVPFLELDIYVSSSPDTYIDNSIIYISYNTAAFGDNIVQNNKITVTRGDVISSNQQYEDPVFYDIDNSSFGIGGQSSNTVYNRTLIGSSEK